MEIWRQVVGYEGLYEVSSFGNVRSVAREIKKANGVVQLRKSSMKKQWHDKDGYMKVKLSKNGIDKILSVHRIAAQAFIGDTNGFDINHIDFDRANNKIDNLEIVSHKDNVMASILAGNHVCCRDMSGENNPNYGNHVLHDIYSSDHERSVRAQGRPGRINGRSRRVRMISDVESGLEFDTMLDCAKYMISNCGVSSRSAEYISSVISKCANSGDAYAGYKFILI